MSKRRLLSSTNRTEQEPCRRPKRMIVPSSEQEWLQGPVYEWNWNAFLEATTLTPLARPLPSVATMVPPSSKPKLDMPLLQHLQPLFKGYSGDDSATNDNNNTAENDSVVLLEAIDDASSCTLTRGQHKRYLQLQSGSVPWNQASRKEFRKLSRLVEQEQEAYRQALETFWDSHKNHYKIGLQHSTISRFCMRYAEQYQAAFGDYTQHFGSCKQVISLQQVSKTVFRSARISNTDDVTLDSFSSRVVHETDQNSRLILDHDHWESTIKVVSGLDESKMPPVTLLEKDSLALQLAKQHDASIMTTLATLQTLLQVSEDEWTHWMIPMVSENGIIILDMPIPRSMTPRQCVTRGVTEGLYQALSSNNSSNNNSSNNTSDYGYAYTLLTLPNRNKSKLPLKVLVRIPQRIYTTTASGECQPLVIHTQLEYFPNRGWEESTSYERACRLLDSLLYNGQVTTRIAHVNPSSLQILQWEHISVAHALAHSTNNTTTLDPMHHLESMVHVLQATETCPSGRHLLCLAPSSTSVMVHSAWCTNNTTDDESVIDVTEELKKADVVYTGAAALRQCARVWQWKEDRIPYTFPIKEEEQSKSRGKQVRTS